MRWTVPVLIRVEGEIVVEAEAAEEAWDAAQALLRSSPAGVDAMKRGASPHTLDLGTASEAEPDARLSAYRCDWCGRGALKEEWGPGRVTCPGCGRLAPSAAGADTSSSAHGCACSRNAQMPCGCPVDHPSMLCDYCGDGHPVHRSSEYVNGRRRSR